MVYLQHQGANNINLVTPSHVVPQVIEALSVAVSMGLNIPIVYNTSAYEKVETLKLLDGVVDIYMPDFKVWDPRLAKRWLKAEDYPERARAAIQEMHAQVGDLVIENGIARRGLLVRHLVMPNNVQDSARVFEFLAGLSKDTFVSILDQYMPMGRANAYPELARATTKQEIKAAYELARSFGLHRFDIPVTRL
jgi:putative pyruvate formate lyase activating enzyme